MLLPPRGRILKIRAFCVVISCRLVYSYGGLEGMWCLFFQIKKFKTLVVFVLLLTSVRYSPFLYSLSYSIPIDCFTLK